MRRPAGIEASAVASPSVAPSQEDPAVAGASRLLGGAWGRHATGRTSRWWTPLRVVLVLTVLTSVLGYLAKAPCRTHPWADEYQYTRVCYTDVFALYYAEQLGSKLDAAGAPAGRVSVPYRDHPVEYPAVIGGLMWTAAEITNLVHPDEPRATANGVVDGRGKTFFDITALLLTLFALATTWAVARLAGRRRIWDAAMFALAPTLLFHGFTNWDLAAVGLTMLGMWAWSRHWPRQLGPAVAGLFLGVATATKLYPLLIVLALLFLCWRAARMWSWVVCAATTVLGFVIAYTPAWILSAQTPDYLRRTAFQFPDASCPTAHYLPGWRWFWSLNTTRPSDWDSLWFLGEHARGAPLDRVDCGQSPVWLNFGVALSTVVVVGLVALLVLGARRRPRLAQVAFLLVAGFLLVNKVDSPQYVLWLVPLAVLARPRWPAFLAWQGAEVALLFARFYFFVGNDRPGQGVPIEVFFTAVVLRDIALVVVVALVVREVLRPEHDVVRAAGVDDPAGGVLDGAPDRWPRRRSVAARPAGA
ncbi:MAG: hypothetical protein QOF18_2528 [Frankiaceae bacterium]|nr:hypothetical protein [Frankiaceae bacterium]